MVILAILLGTMLLAKLLGVSGVKAVDSWPAATRVGLCAMFLFTALAHFNSMRHDLARMVPPLFARPLAVVHFTGLCEILGAIGLVVPQTRFFAAIGLILLLLAVLPANVRAAHAHVTLRGRPAPPLVIRLPMQVLFIALLWWAGIFHAK